MGWELFSQYVRALREAKPKFFVYENNKSMSNAIRASIDETFGFDAVCINSALVSAQNRQRLYWVGKRNEDGTYSKIDIEQPEDRGILLKHILETAECYRCTAEGKGFCLDANYWKTPGSPETFLEGGHSRCNRSMVAEPICTTMDGKSFCVTATEYKGSSPQQTLTKHRRTMVAEPVGVGYRNRREDDGKLYRRFETHNEEKSNALTTVRTDSMVAEPVNITEGGKAQCLRATCYKDGIRNMVGNTIDRKTCVAEPVPAYATPCEWNESGIPTKAISANDGKTYTVYAVSGGQITIKEKEYHIKLADGFYIIRKLTVRECMRLQTVPEWYEFPVSDTQAYKMLGNGWTVDVIAHLLSGCRK